MTKLWHNFVGFTAGIVVWILLWENTASDWMTCWLAGSVVAYVTYKNLDYTRRTEAR